MQVFCTKEGPINLKSIQCTAAWIHPKVVEPKLYADNWLEFVGMLYSDIDGGRYARGESHFRFPLSEETRRELTEKGIPELFTADF